MELKLLENLIKTDETIAVALSGGQDSMALLHALKRLQSKLNFQLKAINVEHGIRGDSSISDSKFCIEQAKLLNIEIKTISVKALEFSKSNGYTIEQGARILRYEAFEQAITEKFADKIATAHHQNDSFETILFNLFRGTGISGIVGIKSENGNIIRPLVNTTKQEIQQYVDYYNIPFVQDQTNFDTNYSRNYLRNEIIPKILERFPRADMATLRTGENLEKDDEFLCEMAKSFVIFTKEGNAQILFCDKQPLFSRASINAMKASGIVKDYSSAHIKLLFDLQYAETGKQLDLINDIVAVKEYDRITLYQKNKQAKVTETKWLAENQSFNDYKITVTELAPDKFVLLEKPRYNSINGDFIEIFADKNKLCGCQLRVPQLGDIFNKIGGGSKTLKKHLVDKKVSKNIRQGLPVLAKGEFVYAILGIETAFHAKVDNCTKSIVKITLSK